MGAALIQHGWRRVSFPGIRLRRAFDAARGMSGIRAEQHAQPRDRAFIIFALSAHIADPGWEVWNGDQFLAQPGEIGDMTHVHDPGRAFITWNRSGTIF